MPEALQPSPDRVNELTERDPTVAISEPTFHRPYGSICKLQKWPTTCMDLAKIYAEGWPTLGNWQASRVATDLENLAAEYWAAQDEIVAAKVEVRAAQGRFRVVRTRLREAIIAEAKKGVRMRDLADETGLSREWIRQVLRAAGVGIWPD